MVIAWCSNAGARAIYGIRKCETTTSSPCRQRVEDLEGVGKEGARTVDR